MNIPMKIILSCLFLTIVVMSCDIEKEACVFKPETDGVNVAVSIEQLQDSFINVRSKAELVSLLTEHKIVSDEIFREQYPSVHIIMNCSRDS